MTSKYEIAHKNTQGPGDARPTAMQIIKDEGLLGELEGKVFLITGANSGIGLEATRAIHATGADVYMTSRNVENGQIVANEIMANNPDSKGRIDVLKLQLDSLQSVRECADDFLSKSRRLNVLICNAGVMACPEGKTQDGYETQFGTNHLGHFLFFQLLKGTLLASSTPKYNSRVVILSSSLHKSSTVQLDDLDFSKRGYDPWVAYGQSKTANIWMATEIERRYGSQGLHALAVDPGAIMTALQRHMDPQAQDNMFGPFLQRFKSTEQGAATTIWAATAAQWEGNGGKYLEDCSISRAHDPAMHDMMTGYVPHAYSPASAQELWDLSNSVVGTTD